MPNITEYSVSFFSSTELFIKLDCKHSNYGVEREERDKNILAKAEAMESVSGTSLTMEWGRRQQTFKSLLYRAMQVSVCTSAFCEREA